MRDLASILSLLAVLSLSVSAENWPRFRGATGQGLSTERNLPTKWSATENVAWKTEIPGEGWASPIVWGERVFVTSATERGTQCRVLCLDRKTGRVLWNEHVFDQMPLRKEGKNSYATPTPCADGQRVYAVFGDGSVAALGFDGATVWTNREVQFYSRHGLGASPILHEGLLIMPYDGSTRVNTPGDWPNNTDEERTGWQLPWDKSFIAALDRRTGRRVWTARRGLSRIAHATPIVWTDADGRAQLLSQAGDVVQGHDLKTGELIWTSEQKGEGLVPSPVLGDGLVFAASGWAGRESFKAFRLGGQGDLRETNLVWEQRKGMPKIPSAIYLRPHLFAITDGGIATCYKADTGEIVWQDRIGGNHSASPVLADGKIYFLSEEGETTIIAAAPEFKVIARNPIGEKCQASLAVSQGHLFLRSEKHVFCVGP
ncbi:MAG: PQQ-binding-like beta-propeller repeat protein [Verrucomicrobia bacterium]|nr:PQQ-binding-like beta-propeller repeat protein [Verrucomicrobiota bacterium]